jgi:ABC-type dipeptide/oligopeptide/nickel transport system ATPase subunit
MAVDHIDLSVNSGKIFGFLGPNGAGKTTIKLLTTLIAPTSGAINTAVGYPLFFKSVEFNFYTIPLVVFASVTGSILFGSIASIISTRLQSSEGFNVVINTVFLFFCISKHSILPSRRCARTTFNCILS